MLKEIEREKMEKKEYQRKIEEMEKQLAQLSAGAATSADFTIKTLDMKKNVSYKNV